MTCRRAPRRRLGPFCHNGCRARRLFSSRTAQKQPAGNSRPARAPAPARGQAPPSRTQRRPQCLHSGSRTTAAAAHGLPAAARPAAPAGVSGAGSRALSHSAYARRSSRVHVPAQPPTRLGPLTRLQARAAVVEQSMHVLQGARADVDGQLARPALPRKLSHAPPLVQRQRPKLAGRAAPSREVLSGLLCRRLSSDTNSMRPSQDQQRQALTR